MIAGLPPLQWLVTFRAVMEAGSFVGAARLLNLTPSAISHQMRALEGRLGRPLFVRARRTVIPNEDALAYSASISESFAQIITATSRVAAGAGVRRLPIHSSPSFATLWLMPRLGAFMRQNRDIDVALFASHEPAKLGEDGFLIDIQYARSVPDACEGIILADELVMPLASPAFIAEYGLSRFSDISRVPLIHSTRSVVQWEQWLARHAPGIALSARGMQSDRSYLALTAAIDGLGLVLESSLHAADYLRLGQLVMPFGPIGIPVAAHRLVYRREDRANQEVTAFINWLIPTMKADRARSLEPVNRHDPAP